MRIQQCIIVGLALVAVVCRPVHAATEAAPTQDATPHFAAARHFTLVYSASIEGLNAGQLASVWLPVAISNPAQEVRLEQTDLPATLRLGHDATYGNAIDYFTAPADEQGNISLKLVYHVDRQPVVARLPGAEPSPAEDRLWLGPDALVPVGGHTMTLLQGVTRPSDTLAVGRLLYDVVDDHMEYRKNQPGWGRGDANWACDSRFGNCTDFHSLFISLARGCGLPARFEIGFELPEREKGDIAGYHCWAFIHPAGHGWVPVDIALANQHPRERERYFSSLDADRVAFTSGRDIQLTPPQHGPRLNYFIYPYVEVDQQPLAASRVKMDLSFRDDPAR